MGAVREHRSRLALNPSHVETPRKARRAYDSATIATERSPPDSPSKETPSKTCFARTTGILVATTRARLNTPDPHVATGDH